ncbi:MAG: ATP-dependent Clp protease proteolytic subunit [Dorea sp.]
MNSPGGSVSAGLAIYDTMQYIKCDISHNLYWYGSKYGIIPYCQAERKGKDYALPNAEIMIHQPSRRSTGTGD